MAMFQVYPQVYYVLFMLLGFFLGSLTRAAVITAGFRDGSIPLWPYALFTFCVLVILFWPEISPFLSNVYCFLSNVYCAAGPWCAANHD